MPHFTPYRPLAALLLAALPGLAFQCGRCDDCMPCEPTRVGGLGLAPTAAAWLPGADSVRFVNSNGFRASLRRELLPPDSVAQHAYVDASYDAYSLLTYNGVGSCHPYFQTARQRLKYTGRNLPLTLSYALVRDLGGQYPLPSAQLPQGSELTRAGADTLPATVLLSFNGQTIHRFPVVRRPYRQPFQATRYLDSVRVAGQLLRGVYWQAIPPDGTNALRLRNLYFQPGQGVVGFTYSNNEEWARF